MSEEESLSIMVNNLEICRLCLNITGNKINIFREDFPKMLEILTGIKVTEDDKLPKVSCLKCALEVKSAILTRRKIIKSYKACIQLNFDSLNSEDLADNDGSENKDSILNKFKEDSPLKKLSDLKKMDVSNDRKLEKIQQLKLTTNIQYLKKLRSFDLKKNLSFESSSKSLLESIAASDRRLPVVRPKLPFSGALFNSQRSSISFSNLEKSNVSPTHSERSHRSNESLRSRFYSQYTLKRQTLSERQRKLRNEMQKLLQAKKGVNINLNELDEEIKSEETVQKGKPTKTYYCKECKVKFTRYALYWNHMARHNHKKCNICNKVVQAVYMKKHMVVHSNVPGICEICGFRSKNSGSLRMHTATHHRGPKPECDLCKRTFLTKNKLMYHIKKFHLNVRDFKCEICGKAFHLKVYLDRHIAGKHMKIRAHICEFCGKGFAGRDTLKTHRRQHTNETPYQCHLCDDRFRQKISLRVHLKSKHQVEEEMSHFCDTCGKGFSSEMALDIHLRIHNEVKCSYCTDTFANDEYLNLHIASVHHVVLRENFKEEEWMMQ